MTRTCLGFLALTLGLLLNGMAQAPTPAIRLFPSPPAPAQPAAVWNMEELAKAPTVYPAVGMGEIVERDGIKPIFYDGVPFGGKPTRVFAWLGIPESKGEKLPAIVLVHGGGGAAYRHWVKTWMDRGYIALAMDTGGMMTTSMEDGNRPKTAKHEFSGAPSTGGGFTKALDPVDQQWPYQAVAAIIRANSLLRSLPEVDPERIGITGYSWGGVLTELAAGADSRFKFAAPVYGAGFLGENSFWLQTDFQKNPPETVQRWIELWDPSQHVGRMKMPVLLCNGTNDKHFRPDSWQKTYRAIPGPVTLSLKVRMPHGNPPVSDPKEIAVFADSILKQGQPLAKVTGRELKNGEASVTWEAAAPITQAELIYTTDSGDWMKREWKTAAAEVDSNATARAKIPEGATALYFNIHDNRDCIVSSEHWELAAS